MVRIQQVESALPAETKRQLRRTQYTSAVGMRVAFFLSQRLLSSQVSGRPGIDGAAAAATIARAVLDPAPTARVPDANTANLVVWCMLPLSNPR